MHRLRTWGRRLFGQEPRQHPLPRASDRMGTPPDMEAEARVAPVLAERPAWQAPVIDGTSAQQDGAVRWARVAALEVEQRWQALDDATQQATIQAARTRALDAPLTLAEHRADAHERTARLTIGQPGAGPTTALPPAYLDTRAVPGDGSGDGTAAAPRCWELVHYAYQPAVRGHVEQHRRAVADVEAVVAYALDAHERGTPVPPVYTEDRALRREVAGQHLVLGSRLTGVTLDEAAHLEQQRARMRPREHELER